MFSLNIVCHLALHRGDAVIVLSKFVLETYLRTIEELKLKLSTWRHQF